MIMSVSLDGGKVVRSQVIKDGGDKHQDVRESWSNKAEFILACVGSAVGLGNMWRFPYLCYKSGGGAFLIPYFIMLFVCGIPLLYMEFAVGQYTRSGPIRALEKMCPLLKGAGLATVVISFFLATYYNVIIAWAMYYLVNSFFSPVPWQGCDNEWNTDLCYDSASGNTTANLSQAVSATQQFFENRVLQMSSGIDEVGGLRWELMACLALAWVLVYFCVWKGIKSSGKVVYVTATLPYVLIIAFLVRALTLPGSDLGLQYLFQPKWAQLLEAKVWVNAAAQNFNSIGIAFGSMIAFSSYSRFDNRIIRDTLTITLVDGCTCIMAGICVFGTLGNLAYEQNKTVDEVVSSGPGLAFIAYPQALAKMPVPQLWSAVFFAMLLCLGIDSQFATVEVIVTSLKDSFGPWIRRYLKRQEVLVLIVCLVSLLCGIPYITKGGIYVFQLVDFYAAALSLMYIAFFEVVAVVWVYGAGRLAGNVRDMTGSEPNLYIQVCWWVASPCLIMAIWIFSLADYQPPTYNNGQYVYPEWSIALGWGIAMVSLLAIPTFAMIALYKAKGDGLSQKLNAAFRSTILDCPGCGIPLCKKTPSQPSTSKIASVPLIGTVYKMIVVRVESQVRQCPTMCRGRSSVPVDNSGSMSTEHVSSV